MNFFKGYPITLKVADRYYSALLHSQSAVNYLSEYVVSEKAETGSKIAKVSQKLYQDNLEYLRKLFPDGIIDPDYNEFQTLALPFYSLLMEDGIVPLHGVSFLVEGSDSVVVFTAPSGTGKTTQYLNWLKLAPETIRIINGDNSLIDTASGSFFKVYSSPWAGKENYHSNCTGNLKSIICLEQGKSNQILEMSLSEKIEFLFPQILVQVNSRKEVRRLCEALSSLIKSIHIVKFINDGTLASTEILKEYLYEELEK